MKVTLDNIYTVLFSVLCFSLAFIGDRFYAIPNGINISLVLIFPFLVNKQKFINHIVKKPIVWFAVFLSFDIWYINPFILGKVKGVYELLYTVTLNTLNLKIFDLKKYDFESTIFI